MAGPLRLALALMLWAAPGAADQAGLAAQIRDLSYTTNQGNTLGQPENEQFMEVAACEVRVRQLSLGAGEPRALIEGVFDLTRTFLIDPAEGANPNIGVGRMGPIVNAEVGGFLILQFNAPYRPVFMIRADREGTLTETAYPVFPYVMTPLEDPGRIRQLNAALWRYQAMYCRLTG